MGWRCTEIVRLKLSHSWYVYWAEPVYLVVFLLLGGTSSILRTFWAEPVKKNTLYHIDQTQVIPKSIQHYSKLPQKPNLSEKGCFCQYWNSCNSGFNSLPHLWDLIELTLTLPAINVGHTTHQKNWDSLFKENNCHLHGPL